jgi:hypothetical protein
VDFSTNSRKQPFGLSVGLVQNQNWPELGLL